MAKDERRGRCCSGDVDRREFLSRAGLGGAVLAAGGLPVIAGPFFQDHFVPADKKLRRQWLDALTAKGERTWYTGDDLETIGMPIGGVAAGQVYLSGDGRLVAWDVFNEERNTGYGQVNYKVGRAPDEAVEKVRAFTRTPAVDQGFALRLSRGERTWNRSLDRHGFPDVRFCGEYPIARLEYADRELPVTARLEVMSPFIPLAAEDSALPATIFTWRLRNVGREPVSYDLAGWLENAACVHSGKDWGERLLRRNRVLQEPGLLAVVGSAAPVPGAADARASIVFADFEGADYGRWKVAGEAFGTAPAAGTLEGQQDVSGFRGKGLINTFIDGDAPQGTLVSPRFTIERRYISFLIGGGAHAETTCMNLRVDGEVVRTATGRDDERLQPVNWNVDELQGKRAQLEIVDRASAPWGHINVDQIEFGDQPWTPPEAELRTNGDFGTMALALLAADGSASAQLPDGELPAALWEGAALTRAGDGERPGSERLRGAVGTSGTLAPGAEKEISFVIAWHMPHLRRGSRIVGRYYGRRFADAGAVVRHLALEHGRLVRDTRAWHETFYDSSLPHWLLDRLHSTVANLATNTCQWWRNGRFWAWEGGGCCRGTCGHVWNYAHALARLFPSLERSAREMQDFAPGVGFDPETGAIAFRGEGWGRWAADSQPGYVLKAYREHTTSTDAAFLERNWRRIRQALQFLIDEDGNADGVLEGQQHQTYDQDYYGANTMVGSLYLAALRAGEEMAREVGDGEFAARCRKIFTAGSEATAVRLFNGEYFVQDVDLDKHPKWQYGDGCLADQLFGQGWAHQLGLGDLYPRDQVRSALAAIWRYNWAPDVGPQSDAHAPERFFAHAGEAGLFTCTWPKSHHLGSQSTRYRNEIWTGIEYQVAGHMAWDGMLTEALAICRGVHERYHPRKHNPWNEIECGDHYARALASWGVFLALCGFEYHGPSGRLGFDPRLSPEDFRAAFTAAEGWGSLSQKRRGQQQTGAVEVTWGRLRLSVLSIGVPDGAVVAEVTVHRGGELPVEIQQRGRRVELTLLRPVVLEAGESLRVELSW